MNNYQPRALHPGRTAVNHAASRVSPRHATGQRTQGEAGKCRVRLDDALGNWFSVVGFECDPLSHLHGNALAVVDRLGARVIKVVESRAGDASHRAANTRAHTVVIEDADNELRGWFTAKGRNVVVLRPDRYVAALTTPQDLDRALTALGAHLATALTEHATLDFRGGNPHRSGSGW